MSLYTDYGGPEEILVGDGSGLKIAHTGSVTLTTAPKPLILSDVLHIPKMQRYLISVIKFCRTNDVSVHFFSYHLLVKDLSTGAPLVKGHNRNDLYELPKTTSLATAKKTFAFITKKSFIDVWHRRLRHPASRILNFMRNSFGLSFDLSNKITDYNGGEYESLSSLLASHGIKHLQTPPHTPQHNVQQVSAAKTLPVVSDDSLVSFIPCSSVPTSPVCSVVPSSSSVLTSSQGNDTLLSSLNSITTQTKPTQTLPHITQTHSMVTRSQNNIFKPKQGYIVSKHTLPELTEPSCVSQAIKKPEWREAMTAEFNSLVNNGIWTLVPPCTSQNVVGNKWVYRIKRKPDGSIDRFKARLVVNGFHQRPGLDFTDTFSPMIKPTTIRTVLCIALSSGWSLKQLDDDNAFLQGTLTDEVYMTQPPGFEDKDNPSHVCKLQKAIYGLKQAQRAWDQELSTFLLQYGFTNSTADASLFVYKSGSDLIYFLVYVVDLIVTGNNQHFVEQFLAQLSHRFSLKDLGSLNFLGVEYLSLTRPDVAYAVNKMSQYLHSPTKLHWTTLKRVLRYLKGHHGLFLRKNSPLNITAFSDADLADNLDDRTSTTVYILYLGNNPVSWKSVKQKTVARSSTEVEYRAVANTATKILWLKNLLSKLHVTSTHQPQLLCDNVGAAYLSANPVFHSRMKHLALDYHFVCQHVSLGAFKVSYVSKKEQLADGLTKSLGRQQFLFLRSKTGVTDGSTVLRGHVKESKQPLHKSSQL
ncbi:Reverse transcriptase, RNA-dependent DNA polymerase [Corchorus capsularis]|uniref:Reverse transcriptase, RNA-dependent DNA polymerase n=1 Tax=Corchorus capsularis TaxID=210143 RepID=A0A1R3JSG2_COCAP|nr:Reverse transcriptase, RNA-dependent DNA polymerase [Corchorus capsularis]